MLAIRVPLTVVETGEVQTPALFGFIRPRLLLPVGMTKGFSLRELRLIFLHELAHLRARDILIWEEGKAGWLEVDTVALCGGSVAGEFVWMVDGVDYATTWVEVRAMWGRGQAGTLAALQDIEARLPFALLGLDSDNGGEFLNYHVLRWLQKRARPVFMTRSRPYKKDDNAHVEQKNWTHIRQCFGYERYDNPEVVDAINALVREGYGQLLNYFHASLKLDHKVHHEGRIRRIYGPAQTPLARVLSSAQVLPQTKRRLEREKAGLNPFALKREIARSLKKISALRQARRPAL